MPANAYKDFIKPFTGEGDVVSFITKVELVAALKKIDDEAKFLPLYLEGHALAIYLEMDDAERKDPAKIKNRLREAFCDGPFVAHAKLSSMKWGGEEVDVYANEIRQLAGFARFEGPSLEHIVKLTFINGLPDYMSVQLQQVGGILDSSLVEILTKARVLTAHKATSAVAAVATNWRPSRQEGRERASKTPPPEGRGLVRHHRRDLGASGANVLNAGDPTWHDIARLRPREPYGVIAVGGKGTLRCTAVRFWWGVGGGRAVRALVDTGCTTTMVRSSLVGDRVGESWMSSI